MATLGIPTHARPEALRRALGSFARDLAESGRAARCERDVDEGRTDILVVDDVVGGPHDGASLAAAREIGARFGVLVRHADRREAERFAGELAAESGAPIEIVRAAIVAGGRVEPAFGAARNLLLLDAAGRCSLQVDDDTVCAIAPAPEAREGLALRSFEDPTEMWFDSAHCGPLDELATAAAGVGYVDLHERMLGARASALVGGFVAADRGDGDAAWANGARVGKRVATSGSDSDTARASGAREGGVAEDGRARLAGGVDLRAASSALMRRIAAGGRVGVTQLGVRGDGAIGGMSALLTLPAASRARLLASEAGYRRAIESRRLARAASSATLTEQELCMTIAIGLDGRDVLPPFAPVGRNEDGLFGSVLATVDPRLVLGHLPFTIAHEPPEARGGPFTRIFDEPARLGVNEVLAGLIGSSRAEIDVRSRRAAIESLGRCLIAWSELPAQDVLERVSWMLGQRLARRLARIEALLREARRAPSYWADDLEELASTIRDRAEEPERAIPAELRARLTTREAREETMRRVSEYGQILLWWPTLVDAARALKRRGRGLGERPS
ncbi:MAG: hypothetical protein R3B70_46020 [Polyangiaceae bacterium]